MSKIQVSATIKIPKGMLEEFKQHAAECIKQVKKKDSETLQYDWFLSSDKTEREIREIYKSSEAVLMHQSNIREPLRALFEKFGLPNFSNRALNGSRMLDWCIRTASELLYISRISRSVLSLLRNQSYCSVSLSFFFTCFIHSAACCLNSSSIPLGILMLALTCILDIICLGVPRTK